MMREMKNYNEDSLFLPKNLLREARRQKGVLEGDVPPVIVLDPDGDFERYVIKEQGAAPCPFWPCYHTSLTEFFFEGQRLGVIGNAVGSSFAVLLAEQLFACGCRLLVSVTSAGLITRMQEPPFFVLIEKALRDEGTSYHYLPPSEFAMLDAQISERLEGGFDGLAEPVLRGAAWTTDAPYRETPTAMDAARAKGIIAVEMESAALYAFAAAKKRPVVCFAHVTNQMAQQEGDFEKGDDHGSGHILDLVRCLRQRLLSEGTS